MLAAPGGPVAALTFDPRTSPQERQAVAARLGVNDPIPVQYLRWLLGDDWMRVDTDNDGLADRAFLIPLDADHDGEPEPPGRRKGILRGDFGNSFFRRRPVMDVIVARIPATLELGLAALALSLVVGVSVGVLSAVRRGGWFDNMSRVMAVIFNAVPVFWLGLILILIFGSRLGWLPMGSRCAPTLTGGCPPIYARIEYLLLPTFVLATGTIASWSRFMRASMLDAMGQDYVRTAHAKGLPRHTVWFKHAARNSLIPLATFLGPAITTILGGAVITERIFSWPGLGGIAVSSVIQQDYPVIMAVVIISAVGTIIGFILTDILYAIVDPRIRLD